MSGPYDPSDPHAKGRKLASYATAWQAAVSLRPGAVMVYHTLGETHDPGTMAAFWDAYDSGLVTLAQRRSADGALEYTATKRTLR